MGPKNDYGDLPMTTKSLSLSLLFAALFIVLSGSIRANEALRFHIKGEIGKEIVLDQTSGLIWQKEYIPDKSWQDAVNYCEQLSYGGFSDWRLPNVDELHSLVNSNLSHPASQFPNMPATLTFLTSSTRTIDMDWAWCINFNSGKLIFCEKTFFSNVRCVRNK